MKRIVSCTAALFVACVVLMAFVASPAYASTILGDSNVEPVTTTIVPQYVMALTKFTVSGSTNITSVSLYVQYTGSDGSQCLKFGIYADNGRSYGQSSPFLEPLVAATRNGYCFQTGDFGPAWETWTLLPGDTMAIGSGTYWLCMLASEAYGTIYHFTYTGAYGGQTLSVRLLLLRLPGILHTRLSLCIIRKLNNHKRKPHTPIQREQSRRV